MSTALLGLGVSLFVVIVSNTGGTSFTVFAVNGSRSLLASLPPPDYAMSHLIPALHLPFEAVAYASLAEYALVIFFSYHS